MISVSPVARKAVLRVLAVGSLLAVAVLLGSERSEATQLLFQVEGGDATFAQQCAPCHGVDGGGGIGPSLQGSTMSDAEMLRITRDGTSIMPAFGVTLSEAELEAVAAFSAALRGAAPDVGSADSVGDGAQLFADNCAGCHGADAEGGLGPNLKTTALSQAELLAIVSSGQGTMPGFAGQVAPEDIEVVVSFLEGLRAGQQEPSTPSLIAEGASLFTANCSRCHGPDASGGEGPALKTSALTDTEMVSVISNGRGAMPGFSAILTSETIDAVVTYIDATRAAAGDGGVVSEAAIGLDTYISVCSSCHGLDGGGGLGPSLVNTKLTANEIISQVFGGHSPEMPAFEGVLDPVQAQDVARYVLEIEGETTSQIPWVVFLGVAVIAVAAAVFAWYSGAIDQLWRRLRGRSSTP